MQPGSDRALPMPHLVRPHSPQGGGRTARRVGPHDAPPSPPLMTYMSSSPTCGPPTTEVQISVASRVTLGRLFYLSASQLPYLESGNRTCLFRLL